MNYLRSSNPFDLARPPQGFLTALADYDDQLVIFASMTQPLFRLARRCTQTIGVPPENVLGVGEHPDTLFMWQHRLVPVTTIVPRAHWSVNLICQLAARDTWRMGGSS